MRISPTSNPRLNEPVGFVLLTIAVAAILGLISYHPQDPSWNAANASSATQNLVGAPGAWFSDISLQWLGLAAWLLPAYVAALGWIWLRSADKPQPYVRILGAVLFLTTFCAALGLRPDWTLWRGAIRAGGVIGSLLAEQMVSALNLPGAALLLTATGIVSIYLMTSFRLAHLTKLRPETAGKAGKSGGGDQPGGGLNLRQRWTAWVTSQREKAQLEKPKARKGAPAIEDETDEAEPASLDQGPVDRDDLNDDEADVETLPPPALQRKTRGTSGTRATLPPIIPYEVETEDPVEDDEPAPAFAKRPEAIEDDEDAPWEEYAEEEEEEEAEIDYRVPTTSHLHPPHGRTAYDQAELHAIAGRIQAKFEEFKIGGEVSLITPGPVVTTFEFKPSPGVKYSKIINLSEDLCLALETESILVERVPGKSTVGIEVPNSKREVISLREILESREFREARSPLTVALGKDISGRIKIADLASMPHLLVAGSTGSGKSVMVNAFIMSILLRATPAEVRFIMVDPKTVELGLYHEIPHLLTPVITDMKKASNALKNATAEMERRLKLLAEHGVRNIDQFNAKMAKRREMLEREGNADLANALKNLPYILIIIDELADLMILEGRQIEEAITRLAQMARAVGIHLVLATQRPSVDVITGLIKANVPARISFRLATRIDSRTILDSMGAEALLGKGDMLFLPPGTARMVRVHGPFVTEEEIEAVVQRWKAQGKPRYENDYLAAPPDEIEGPEDEDLPGFDDPMYQDAVRVVCEMGKASTSTLQRRLRLGYSRAASILDAMERDGIIGPPNGSRPRELLKPPDWLDNVPD
ncbi:MAG: DNA translocase FtsK [Acidobacteria bacterium]|nr:DNA translocase FtsK [Acidobacteriota bacterium]